MKIRFDKKKSTETLAAIAQSTTDVSKKVAAGVKSGTAIAVEKTKTNASAVIEKTKSDAYSRKLKKFNPLFPDRYNDSSFNLPNIIVIVDDLFELIIFDVRIKLFHAVCSIFTALVAGF